MKSTSRLLSITGLIFLLAVWIVGCRKPAYVPKDWRPEIFSFDKAGIEKKIFIPQWWYTRKPIEQKEFEVYFIHTEQNYTMGISLGKKLREKLVSRYPTAKEQMSGKMKRDQFRIEWRTGYYSNSENRWGEVEVTNYWGGNVMQFWYEHAPGNISQHFDLIVKQFLHSL